MSVLIVEDEFLIRLIVAEEFAAAGYDVQQAESGDSAATLIEHPQRAFSLLVTDIHMPGRLDGIGLARLMRGRHPGIPVIYTTGRPDALGAVEDLSGNDVVVAKPFTPSELLRVARRLLGQEDAGDHRT